MSTISADTSYLPNIPGFRPKQGPKLNGAKKSFFKLVGGEVFLKEEALPTLAEIGDETSTIAIGTISPKKKRLPSEDVANLILTFNGYFEDRDQSTGALKIRECKIYFYVADSTVKVVEKTQQNSGMPQGTLVRRAEITKPDGVPLNEADFKVGEIIPIYGRYYKYVIYN